MVTPAKASNPNLQYTQWYKTQAGQITSKYHTWLAEQAAKGVYSTAYVQNIITKKRGAPSRKKSEIFRGTGVQYDGYGGIINLGDQIPSNCRIYRKRTGAMTGYQAFIKSAFGTTGANQGMSKKQIMNDKTALGNEMRAIGAKWRLLPLQEKQRWDAEGLKRAIRP